MDEIRGIAKHRDIMAVQHDIVAAFEIGHANFDKLSVFYIKLYVWGFCSQPVRMSKAGEEFSSARVNTICMVLVQQFMIKGWSDPREGSSCEWHTHDLIKDCEGPRVSNVRSKTTREWVTGLYAIINDGPSMV